MKPTPDEPPARRRDAEENRTKIIDAARAVFAEQGFEVALDAIAKRAGVGRATLYRNFPDRFALGTAIFDHNLSALEALARAMGDRPDTFMNLLTAMIEQQIDAHSLVPGLLLGPRAPNLHALVRRVTRLLSKPLRIAREAGVVRPDLTLGDVLAALAMSSAVVSGASTERARRRRALRALDLLTHGLEPRASSVSSR